MVVVTVFFSILNQREYHLVKNRKENCQPYQIRFEKKWKHSFLSVGGGCLSGCFRVVPMMPRDASLSDGCAEIVEISAEIVVEIPVWISHSPASKNKMLPKYDMFKLAISILVNCRVIANLFRVEKIAWCSLVKEYRLE